MLLRKKEIILFYGLKLLNCFKNQTILLHGNNCQHCKETVDWSYPCTYFLVKCSKCQKEGLMVAHFRKGKRVGQIMWRDKSGKINQN